MSRKLRRILIVTGLACAALGALYWWYVVDARVPGAVNYTLDLAEMRRLADAYPGEKPQQLRYEHVADFSFAGAMVMAGDSWRSERLAVYAWQLVYADRSVVVDGAMSRELAQPAFLVPFYDDAAYARVVQGLDQADLIVITHEHADHFGGVAQHPRLGSLLPRLRLTQEQLDHPEAMKPLQLPAETFARYQPLRYQGYLAIAPGVVLVQAAGHTPGSQMVYVQRADGRELLLLGDVSWKLRNVERQRERPRFMTELLIGEDRRAVAGQLQALHRLAASDPGIALVPGHDAAVVQRLAGDGLVQPGFVLR